MSGLGVIHLVYKAQRALPVWYRFYTHSLSELFGFDFGGAVQIRTGGVQKYLLLQIVYHGLVNICERSWNRTPIVQGSTGPPSLVQVVYT